MLDTFEPLRDADIRLLRVMNTVTALALQMGLAATVLLMMMTCCLLAVVVVQDEVFNMDTFFVTDVDKTPIAVAFMGRFRQGSDEAFAAVDAKLQSVPGGLEG